MAMELDEAGTDRMAVAFLIDDVGIDHDSVARLLEIIIGELDLILEGKGAPAPCRRVLDGLVAIESLLFGGYSPQRAAQWMNMRSADLNNMVPAAVLIGGHEDAIGRVLKAVVRRVSR